MPTDQRLRRHPGPPLLVAALGLTLTALAARAVRRHLGDRVPYASWTIGESTMWTLASRSAVSRSHRRGSWLSWRLPTNRTGLCLTVAGFALAASIYGSYTPSPASPWAERLLPTVVDRSDRHRRVELAHGPHAEAIVEPVPAGGARLRDRRGREASSSSPTGCRKTVPGGRRTRGTCPPGQTPATSAVGRNVVAVLLHAVAPILFLAFVARNRANMPPSVRATSRPAFVAAVMFGVVELWAFVSTMAASPLGGFGGRSTAIGMVGACLEFARFGAVAVLLVWSESMRRRSRISTVSEASSVELGPLGRERRRCPLTWRGSSEIRPRGSSSAVPTRCGIVGGGDARSPRDDARAVIKVADRDGDVIAAVEHDAAIVASSVTRDAMMTSIGMALLRHARQVEADQRTARGAPRPAPGARLTGPDPPPTGT